MSEVSNGGKKHDPVILKLSSNVRFTLSQLRYVTFTVIGIALLWPWNCFLSASAYYGDRFVGTPSLAKTYSSTFMTVSTIVTMLFTYYLSQVQEGVNYQYRVKCGLVITIAVFIAMAISCVSDGFLGMNDYVFYTLLMLMVLISAMATALAQNGTMATVNVLGSIFTNAVMVGQAIAGALPSIALIISLLVAGDKKRTDQHDKRHGVEKNYGLFMYFINASLVSAASICLLAFTNHYSKKSAYKSLDNDSEEGFIEDYDISPAVSGEQSDSRQSNFVPFSVLWGKLKKIVMTIFITFCVTLVFPVFASTVQSVHSESKNRFLQKNIYIPFIYFVWNLGDLAGRILCGIPRTKTLVKKPSTLLTYSIARLSFIPLFMTCNIHPGKSEPTFSSDIWYILLQFLFGLSNGQLCTSCFMVVAEHCDDDDQKEAAGGFTSIFLTGGLAAGSILSYLLVPLVG